jgi:hypothetical protein
MYFFKLINQIYMFHHMQYTHAHNAPWRICEIAPDHLDHLDQASNCNGSLLLILTKCLDRPWTTFNNHQLKANMPKLSVNDLDRILDIPLTIELVREHYSRPMTDDEAQDRLDTVQHECAHLVAAIACKGASITGVELYAPHAPRRKPAGRVQSLGCLLEHEAFMSFAGHAWELKKHNGDARRAANDREEGIEYARQRCVPYQPIYDAADRFVNVTAIQAIRDASVGVVCLMPQNGMLKNGKLAHLVRWLRPQIQVPEYLMGLN